MNVMNIAWALVWLYAAAAVIAGWPVYRAILRGEVGNLADLVRVIHREIPLPMSAGIVLLSIMIRIMIWVKIHS